MKAYRIKFRTPRALENAMRWMFKRGFVFTCERIRTLERLKEEYSDNIKWHYIFVGHQKECKCVMNTGPYSDSITGHANNDVWIDVSFAKFVKEVLPTY